MSEFKVPKAGVYSISTSSAIGVGVSITNVELDNLTGTSAVFQRDYRDDWTQDQWIALFKRNGWDNFPEAIEAMRTMSSKLYKSLK